MRRWRSGQGDATAGTTGAQRARVWRRTRRHRAIGHLAAIVLVMVLVPTLWSWGTAMTAPGSSDAATRTVEWVRDHGGSPLVDVVEQAYYRLNPPPTGGLPPAGIPLAPDRALAGHTAARTQTVRRRTVGASPQTAATTPAAAIGLPRPAEVASPAGSPLRNEGVWAPVGPTVGGVPTMEATYVRPDAVHTSLVAGVVWLDPTLLHPVLIPGLQQPQPGAIGASMGGQVPGAWRPRLAAAFNAGFRMKDARGGWYSNGNTVVPLADGAASFVIGRDGRVDIGAWGRDVSMSPNVVSVRQNLALIVDNGKAAPELSANPGNRWGVRLDPNAGTWRSGVGVDANGGVIYVVGEGIDLPTLADLLVRAGAVRGMEFDIHPKFVTFNLYSPTNGAINGAKLLPHIERPADRYLSPDERDFVAWFTR